MGSLDDSNFDFDWQIEQEHEDEEWVQMEAERQHDEMCMQEDAYLEHAAMDIPIETSADVGSNSALGSAPGTSMDVQSQVLPSAMLSDNVDAGGQMTDPVLPMLSTASASTSQNERSQNSSTDDISHVRRIPDFSKRRLRGKQGIPESCKDAVLALELKRRKISTTFDVLSKDKKHRACNVVRVTIHRKMQGVKRGERMALAHGVTLHCTSATDYEKNAAHFRKHLLYDLAISSGQQEGISGWAAKKWLIEVGEAKTIASSKANVILKSSNAILTWHGNFGVMQVKDVPSTSLSVELLEKWCRRQPSIVSAWDGLFNRLLSVSDRFGLLGISFSLEICSRTWKMSGELKLHLHAWILQHPLRHRVPLDAFLIDKEKQPFYSQAFGRESRGASVFSGCYYVCCAKIGQVFSYSTKAPHVDFAVKPDWIIRMFAAEKMTGDHARDDLIRQVINADSYLQQLTFVEEYMKERREAKLREEVLYKIMASSKPPRHVDGLSAWEKQWENGQTLDRYKFLVLDGETRMGKTRYVQSALVAAPEQALILDCGDAVIPALKGNFDRAKHTLIMFDEAHASMVMRCKKLFQAGANPVTYGSSPTNAYVHTVWLHGIKLVIGSNCWAEELKELKESERTWIVQNSVYIAVDRPLWIQ